MNIFKVNYVGDYNTDMFYSRMQLTVAGYRLSMLQALLRNQCQSTCSKLCIAVVFG